MHFHIPRSENLLLFLPYFCSSLSNFPNLSECLLPAAINGSKTVNYQNCGRRILCCCLCGGRYLALLYLLIVSDPRSTVNILQYGMYIMECLVYSLRYRVYSVQLKSKSLHCTLNLLIVSALLEIREPGRPSP